MPHVSLSMHHQRVKVDQIIKDYKTVKVW